MIGYLDLILRLVIWFLLTADLSPANIIIGICIALILPRNRTVTAYLLKKTFEPKPQVLPKN